MLERVDGKEEAVGGGVVDHETVRMSARSRQIKGMEFTALKRLIWGVWRHVCTSEMEKKGRVGGPNIHTSSFLSCVFPAS